MLGVKALSRLFGERSVARACVPEGVVLYALGDIHGRADLLGPVLEQVLTDSVARDGKRRVLVCLGDYVDRGPHSREVIEALIQLSRFDGLECHFLRGNHDQTMLDFLTDPGAGPDWCEYGGRETMVSYGVQPPRGRPDAQAWEEVSDAFAAAVPPSHVAFLRSLELSYVIGDYFFSHAGARPGVALEDQSDEDLMWIRQPFLNDRKAFDKIVVHGHTPAEEAYADDRRIGLDTGAYATGLLTAARLEGDRRGLLQAKRQTDGGVQVLNGDL